MRYPKNIPQLFHEVVIDFINALDVSIERLAPFAGLRPQQLRRLGRDGKHHTLGLTAINRLIDAPQYIGKDLPREQKEAWGKRLKISSLYTVLILAAHRRTGSSWPKTPEDYNHVWQTASDLVVYSGYALCGERDGSYKTRDVRGFPGDSTFLWNKWSTNQLEDDEAIISALDELDRADD